MAKEIQKFYHSEFGELGVICENEKYYFPATKCATILGYKNPQKAIRDHCKGVNESFTPIATTTREERIVTPLTISDTATRGERFAHPLIFCYSSSQIGSRNASAISCTPSLKP